MDLRQLQSLVAVADHRTFSAAARALHTVQSNVSTHIAKLEREVGATLVDRTMGRLTPEGEVVVARARRISAELTALTADVASITSDVVGSAHVGMIGTTGRWLTPLMLDELSAAHPNVDVIITEATTSSLLPLLFTDQADLAVVNLPLRYPDLEVIPLFDEDLIAVVPVNHPLAGVGSHVSFAQLAEHPLLLGPKGSNLRDQLDEHAHAAGVSLTALAQIDGVRLTATMAFQGYAAAIVPATAIPTWASPVEWRPLSVLGEPRRSVGLAIRRKGMLSAPASVVRDVVIDVVRANMGSEDGVHEPTGLG